MNDSIRWGIIGCGDVTELKSGPAFNKVAGSQLIAVMRRDAEKAKDYAIRHKVPKYYSNAQELIDDKDINAIYIATPPASHEAYALAAIAAGKPVYVEKPMALNYAAAQNILAAASNKAVKVVVAHYRNAQPFFIGINNIIRENGIGKIDSVALEFKRKPLGSYELQNPQKAWRVDAAVSGGGLFHDMAPHQLGLMLYYFGKVKNAFGSAVNTNKLYTAEDRVEANILFECGVKFHGLWNFNDVEEKDECIIYGTKGMMRFPIFGEQRLQLVKNGKEQLINVEPLQHVQQPMIEKTVLYFSGLAENPCPPEQGCEVMRLIDIFTSK